MMVLPLMLSPSVVNSFAYNTYKDRLPVIIVKIVDSLYRNKKELTSNDNEKLESIKYITGELSRLRHEITTNKSITYFTKTILGDEDMWNKAIENEIKKYKSNEEQKLIWYETTFLFGECYMYRRIFQAVLESGFKNLDQFGHEKNESIYNGVKTMIPLTIYLQEIINRLEFFSKDELFNAFEIFFKMCLWGNEADMSLNVSKENSKISSNHNSEHYKPNSSNWRPTEIVNKSENCLLCDDYKKIFDLLYEIKSNEIVRIIIFVDNSGIEFITDLHFVEFLLSSPLGENCQIDIIVKSIPWYISDVTIKDVHTTLSAMCTNAGYEWLGKRLLDRIKFNNENADKIGSKGVIRILTHFFMTSPYPFYEMNNVAPDLYESLQHVDLLIFKGDLNYRKLVSDRDWSYSTTSFYDGLCGFYPTNLVTLRILKCDTLVGVTEEQVVKVTPEFDLKNKDWMTSSKYAVIQSYIK